jgi:hypothetical protein
MTNFLETLHLPAAWLASLGLGGFGRVKKCYNLAICNDRSETKTCFEDKGNVFDPDLRNLENIS